MIYICFARKRGFSHDDDDDDDDDDIALYWNLPIKVATV